MLSWLLLNFHDSKMRWHCWSSNGNHVTLIGQCDTDSSYIGHQIHVPSWWSLMYSDCGDLSPGVCCRPLARNTYSVSQKKPIEVFWQFSPNGWEFLVQFYTPITCSYIRQTTNFLFNYLQLWQSYGILSSTTQRADGGHFEHMMRTEYLHSIWHNFVKVKDNWIKIYRLAWVGTHNRRVKFGLNIPSGL